MEEMADTSLLLVLGLTGQVRPATTKPALFMSWGEKAAPSLHI